MSNKSSSSFLNLVYYSTFAFIYTFALTHNFVYCRFSEYDILLSMREKLQFLTVWCSVLQSVYYLLSAINALQHLYSKTHDTALNRLCNRIYVSLVFPIGVLVCVSFWAIWSVDRELVFPRIYDAIIPLWQNHVMHTLPLVTAILDSYLVFHAYPRFRSGIALTSLFAAAYLGLTFYIAYVHGRWLYPILKVLSFANRAIFMTGLYATLFAIYKLGEWTNRTFWSSVLEKKKAKKAK